MGNKSKPICEPLPGNCTIDQVYWSPDPTRVPEECHIIGQRGPCSIDQVITRDLAGVISCVIPPEKNETLSKSEPKISVKAEPKTSVKEEPKTIVKIEENIESNTEITVETNTEINVQEKTETKADKKAIEPKVESKKESKKEAAAEVIPSPWDRPACPLGSYRSQTNKCSKQFP